MRCPVRRRAEKLRKRKPRNAHPGPSRKFLAPLSPPKSTVIKIQKGMAASVHAYSLRPYVPRTIA
jgi:hypothetical protein